jgi:hypothetical protein
MFRALILSGSPGALSRLLSPPLGRRLAAALRAAACQRADLSRDAALLAGRIEAGLAGAAAARDPVADDSMGTGGGGGASATSGGCGQSGARPGAAPTAAGAAAASSAGAAGLEVSFDQCASCRRRDARLMPCSACHMARCARPHLRAAGARAAGLHQPCLCFWPPSHVGIPRSCAIANFCRYPFPPPPKVLLKGLPAHQLARAQGLVCRAGPDPRRRVTGLTCPSMLPCAMFKQAFAGVPTHCVCTRDACMFFACQCSDTCAARAARACKHAPLLAFRPARAVSMAPSAGVAGPRDAVQTRVQAPTIAQRPRSAGRVVHATAGEARCGEARCGTAAAGVATLILTLGVRHRRRPRADVQFTGS